MANSVDSDQMPHSVVSDLDLHVHGLLRPVSQYLGLLRYIGGGWGRPTDIGLQLGKPAILAAGKGRGGMFLFLLFLHFHSCSSFFPVPLFHLHYCLFYLFSPFLWETTQNDPQGLMCR